MHQKIYYSKSKTILKFLCLYIIIMVQSCVKMESNTNEILGNSSPVESLKPLNFNAEIKGSKVKKSLLI